MRKALAVCILCGISLLTGHVLADDSAADAILGQWFTEHDESIIEIYESGESYCGKIVWLKAPFNSDGSEKVDSNNSDASLKTRKIIGMDIVTGFKHKGDESWDSGKIYDPNNGKTYSCLARLDGEALIIRGYIGISLIGRTTVWKRVKEDADLDSFP